MLRKWRRVAKFGFGLYHRPLPLPTVMKHDQMKHDQRKDDLVEGTQAKTTKWATKCAVSVFQGNFGFL